MLLLVSLAVVLGIVGQYQKLSGKWRFELFYCDYSVGVARGRRCGRVHTGIPEISNELTFQDNLLIANRHAMAFAFGAGMVFNLANMLLLGAMQVSGMAVAFPIAFGLALVIGAIWRYVLNPVTNVVLVFSGAILTLLAVITVALAHIAQRDDLRRAKTPPRPDPRAPRVRRPPSAAAGIVLGLLSGILMSLYPVLSDSARAGETALSPYSAALLVGGGIFLSTLLYTPFFLNFPVQGIPLQLGAYVSGTKKQHLWGFLGGFLWMAGTLAAYMAVSSPAAAQPVVSYALSQGVPLLAALWGLLAWREFRGATVRVKMLLTAMLVLYSAGIAVVAVVPLYSK